MYKTRNLTGLLIFAIILFSTNIYSQAQIKFHQKTYDFGKINEEVGKANAKFIFTNVGNKDLIIKNVRTSCGCTSSDYTKTPVKPGEKGYIKATYHTTNRPGNFRKSITVAYNNPDKPRIILFIKGFVIKKDPKFGAEYRVALGNLKLMNNNINFGKIKPNDKRTDSIKILNMWSKPMHIDFKNVPKHLKVKCTDKKIESRKSAFIIVEYNASKRSGVGRLFDKFIIVTNDIKLPEKTISIVSEIEQDFSNLTKRQKRRAPVIYVEEKEFSFGTVKAGTKVKHSFKIENHGKNDLKILKVQASCGCTATTTNKKVIKKKDSATIDVVFDTRRRYGKQAKKIKVITNDPVNPVTTLKIQGACIK